MLKKVFKIILIFFFLVFLGVLFFAGFLFYQHQNDFISGQSFSKYNIPYSIIFTDRYGKEFYRSFENQNREWVEIEKISPYLKELTIIAEDKRFYSHFGIDVIGISRAFIENIKAGNIVQGGSTLTQQIAKKAFLTDEKKFSRKIKEMFIAFGIESKMSKKEILEMYLNIAPYGPTLAGVKSSAKFYFQKNPLDLSIAESLVLAVLPQSPVLLARQKEVKNWLGKCSNNNSNCSIFDKNYQASRIEKILFSYAKKNKLSRFQTAQVWEELREIELPERKNLIDNEFQHFRFYVQKFLVQNKTNLTDYPGGLIVKTSLDKDLQSAVFKFMQEEARKDIKDLYGAKNSAILVLNNEERAPLVWMGSLDFWDSEINGQVDVLQSRRQTGSTIKPFIYTGMFDQGYSTQTTMWDTRVRFAGERKILQNSDGHYLGATTPEVALATSRNVPAAQALYIAGGEKKVKSYLDKAFGFKINKNYANDFFGWTLALGTAPIKLADLANGYTTLGTGKFREICPVLEIKTTTGEKLDNICNLNTKKFTQTDSMFLTNDILSNVFLRPQGDWRKNITIKNSPLAVKTGTSNAKIRGEDYPVDNLIIGYNPEVTVLGWLGNSDGSLLKQGSFATFSIAPYWKEITEGVIEKYPEFSRGFLPPPNLTKKEGVWYRKSGFKTKYKIPSMSIVSKEENALKKAKTLKIIPD